MTNILRTGFIAIALTFVFSAFAVSETSAQTNTEILKRMDNHYKALQTLQANITMAKYNPQVNTNDISQGSIWYVPAKDKNKMAVRLNWETPLVEYLTVTKGTYKIFRPVSKIAYEGTVQKAKGRSTVAGPLSFMSMSKAQLTDAYRVERIGEEKLSDGSGAIHLKLTPKTAQNYKLAEIWVDSNGMILQAKIVEKNDDSTTILLTNLKKNETIQGSIFNLDFPKGVKPIKN